MLQIDGKRAYVDQACRAPEVAAALARRGLHSAAMHEAEVFIVRTPGQADVFVTVASAVLGAYQVSQDLLQLGRGAAIKMMPVGHLPKTLYISPACAAKQIAFCVFFSASSYV